MIPYFPHCSTSIFYILFSIRLPFKFDTSPLIPPIVSVRLMKERNVDERKVEICNENAASRSQSCP